MKTELVTTLKREATKILAELHQYKEPVLITEHGLPSTYLLDGQPNENFGRYCFGRKGYKRKAW